VTRAESPIRLDLRLHAPGGIFIDNNVAKAELRLDLTVTGPAHAPVVLGTVQIVDARVTFNGRELIVSGGTIDFRDRFEINPVLNLSADTQIATPDGEYTVTVSVAGTANEPRVRMQADDASLSQNDVASLLLFGKTGAQLQRDSTELTPGSALTLVPTGAVGERLGGLIGVDRFEVEAVQGRTAGSIEPRISIGKDLTERLRTLVSSSLGTEARQLVQLEYRVTRDVSLVGSWESASQADPGAWGGDVKFRYEFRRVPLSLGGGW
jgi:translocation and assembly module TamB